MTDEESKKLTSLMGTLKGTIIQNVNPSNFDKFIGWCNKLALDTNKDKLEKGVLKRIQQETNPDEKTRLSEEKKKYLPANYPSDIKIGDIVHINLDMDIVVKFPMDTMES